MNLRELHSSGRTGLDPASFLAAYDAHAEALLRFFAGRTLDPEVAADLTAETLADAFATRARFDPRRGDPRMWLFGIASHKLASYTRRLKVERSARRAIGLADLSLTPDDYERIESLIDFADLGRRVRSALHTLAPDQREAVACRVFDELGYDEIAVRLGCSNEVARARVSRGLRSLARALASSDVDRGGSGATI